MKNRNKLNSKIWGSVIYTIYLTLAGCSKRTNGFQYTRSQWKETRLCDRFSMPQEDWVIIQADINGIQNAAQVAKSNAKKANRFLEITKDLETTATKRALCLYKELTGFYTNSSSERAKWVDVTESVTKDIQEIEGFYKFLLEGFSLIALETAETVCEIEEEVNTVIATCRPKQLTKAAANISHLQNKEIATVSSIQKARLKQLEDYLVVFKTIEERVADQMMYLADEIACRGVSTDIAEPLKSHLEALTRYIIKARILAMLFKRNIQEDVTSKPGNGMSNWLTKGEAMFNQSLQLVESVAGKVAPVVIGGAKYAMNKGCALGSYTAQGVWGATKWGAPIVGKGIWGATKWGVPLVGKGLLGTVKLVYRGSACCAQWGYNGWKAQCNAQEEA